MTRQGLVGLVLLNLGLLGALAVVSLPSHALPNTSAHAGASIDDRGEYIAVSGYIAGTKTPIIWVVNQSTQEIVAFQFDSQKEKIVGFGYRNMNNDAIIIQRNR